MNETFTVGDEWVGCGGGGGGGGELGLWLSKGLSQVGTSQDARQTPALPPEGKGPSTRYPTTPTSVCKLW